MQRLFGRGCTDNVGHLHERPGIDIPPRFQYSAEAIVPMTAHMSFVSIRTYDNAGHEQRALSQFRIETGGEACGYDAANVGHAFECCEISATDTAVYDSQPILPLPRRSLNGNSLLYGATLEIGSDDKCDAPIGRIGRVALNWLFHDGECTPESR